VSLTDRANEERKYLGGLTKGQKGAARSMCGGAKGQEKTERKERERCRFRLDARFGALGDVPIYVLSRGSLTRLATEREREREREKGL
jgi:hypothetical protein